MPRSTRGSFARKNRWMRFARTAAECKVGARVVFHEHIASRKHRDMPKLDGEWIVAALVPDFDSPFFLLVRTKEQFKQLVPGEHARVGGGMFKLAPAAALEAA